MYILSTSYYSICYCDTMKFFNVLSKLIHYGNILKRHNFFYSFNGNMVLFNKFIIEVCLCTLGKFWNSQRIFKSEVTLIRLKVVLTYGKSYQVSKGLV